MKFSWRNVVKERLKMKTWAIVWTCRHCAWYLPYLAMKNYYGSFYIGHASNYFVVLQWSKLHMQLNRFSLIILNARVDRHDLPEFNIKTSMSRDLFMDSLLTYLEMKPQSSNISEAILWGVVWMQRSRVYLLQYYLACLCFFVLSAWKSTAISFIWSDSKQMLN